MQYFSLTPPVKWRAGFVGEAKTPFYFDCADCGAKEPEIAGCIGTGPALEQVAVLATTGSAIVKTAMFCKSCFEKRGPFHL